MRRAITVIGLLLFARICFATATVFPVDPTLPSTRCFSAASGILIISIHENRDTTIPPDGISDNKIYFWKSGRGAIDGMIDHPAAYNQSAGSGSYTGSGTYAVYMKVKFNFSLVPVAGYPGWYRLTISARNAATGIVVYPATTVYTQGAITFPPNSTTRASLRAPRRGQK